MGWVHFFLKCAAIVAFLMLLAAMSGCAVIRDCTVNACRGFH